MFKSTYESPLRAKHQPPLDPVADCWRFALLEINPYEMVDVDQGLVSMIKTQPSRPELLQMKDIEAASQFSLQIALQFVREHV